MRVCWLDARDGPPYFPDDLRPDETGLVALGGDLSEGRLLAAYRRGVFPWTGRYPIPWCSPDPRLILRPQEFRCARSLRKRIRSGIYEVRYDTRFEELMVRCALIPRVGQTGRSWITPNMLKAYTRLHRRGVAHSVETYRDGELVGGLYGLSIGRAFFGESMFAAEPDASKVALEHLCRRLARGGYAWIDCQQETKHLKSLGAVAVTREVFLAELREAVDAPSGWEEGA